MRPICGQCLRFNRERDCEYTDGDQRSRTEILEEQITQLQARLHTLESSVTPASSVPRAVAASSSRTSSPTDFAMGMYTLHINNEGTNNSNHTPRLYTSQWSFS